MLAVFGLVIERLIYLHNVQHGQRLTNPAKWTICTLCFILPWILTASNLIPIFVSMIVAIVPETYCTFFILRHQFFILSVLSFFPAAAAIFIATPLAGLLYCLRSNSVKSCSPGVKTPCGESLVVITELCLLSVVCETPYFTAHMITNHMECRYLYCDRLNTGLQVGMWLRLAKCALMPFIWLIYSDVRRALLCYVKYDQIDKSDRKAIKGIEEESLVNTHTPTP